jgi:hypothetical protein
VPGLGRRDRSSIQVLADGLGHECGSVSTDDGCVELCAEVVIESDGDAHGHGDDNTNDSAADTIADPIGVSAGVRPAQVVITV